jgi:hypothetical protein
MVGCGIGYYLERPKRGGRVFRPHVASTRVARVQLYALPPLWRRPVRLNRAVSIVGAPDHRDRPRSAPHFDRECSIMWAAERLAAQFGHYIIGSVERSPYYPRRHAVSCDGRKTLTGTSLPQRACKPAEARRVTPPHRCTDKLSFESANRSGVGRGSSRASGHAD